MNKPPKIVRACLRAALLVGIVAFALVMTQDLQIFPGVFLDEDLGQPLPQGVVRMMVETADKEQLDVWRLPGEGSSPFVALIFHGNFGTVRDFFPIQRWFARQGMTSYGFDYRGFGASTGWPSEQGLYEDGAAVWRRISAEEGIGPESLVVYGISIGTGPAAELASKVDPAALILLSPYSNLADVAKESWLIRPLLPFLRYRLPTVDYVAALSRACVLVAHGERDTVIRPAHSAVVARAYGGKSLFQITSPEAGHNDLFNRTRGELADALQRCLRSGGK